MENKETLEEAAERLYSDKFYPMYGSIRRDAFINGAKWQQERSYSEEEVLGILNEFCDNFYENSIREDIIIKWFKQFKKKIMTPKQKARELVDKYKKQLDTATPTLYRPIYQSKQCALIAVEEMLGEYQSMSDLESKIVINDEVRFIVHQLQYWMLVKQEIEKL